MELDPSQGRSAHSQQTSRHEPMLDQHLTRSGGMEEKNRVKMNVVVVYEATLS